MILKYATRLIFTLSAIALLVGCSEDNPQKTATLQPADLLPASGEISGWDKVTGPGNGEASDPPSLLNLIDGGAEIYIEYGFVEGVIQDYQGTIGSESSTLVLWIFDQGSAANAEELFDDERLNFSNLTPWDQGDEAVIDETLLFQIAIHLRAERFYLRVIIDKNDDEVTALATAQDFALAVVEDIG